MLDPRIQKALDALADLTVPSAGADLEPLHHLRHVGELLSALPSSEETGQRDTYLQLALLLNIALSELPQSPEAGRRCFDGFTETALPLVRKSVDVVNTEWEGRRRLDLEVEELQELASILPRYEKEEASFDSQLHPEASRALGILNDVFEMTVALSRLDHGAHSEPIGKTLRALFVAMADCRSALTSHGGAVHRLADAARVLDGTGLGVAADAMLQCCDDDSRHQLIARQFDALGPESTEEQSERVLIRSDLIAPTAFQPMNPELEELWITERGQHALARALFEGRRSNPAAARRWLDEVGTTALRGLGEGILSALGSAGTSEALHDAVKRLENLLGGECSFEALRGAKIWCAVGYCITRPETYREVWSEIQPHLREHQEALVSVVMACCARASNDEEAALSMEAHLDEMMRSDDEARRTLIYKRFYETFDTLLTWAAPSLRTASPVMGAVKCLEQLVRRYESDFQRSEKDHFDWFVERYAAVGAHDDAEQAISLLGKGELDPSGGLAVLAGAQRTGGHLERADRWFDRAQALLDETIEHDLGQSLLYEMDPTPPFFGDAPNFEEIDDFRDGLQRMMENVKRSLAPSYDPNVRRFIGMARIANEAALCGDDGRASGILRSLAPMIDGFARSSTGARLLGMWCGTVGTVAYCRSAR